jgi:hypothetical protein
MQHRKVPLVKVYTEDLINNRLKIYWLLHVQGIIIHKII